MCLIMCSTKLELPTPAEGVCHCIVAAFRSYSRGFQNREKNREDFLFTKLFRGFTEFQIKFGIIKSREDRL